MIVVVSLSLIIPGLTISEPVSTESVTQSASVLTSDHGSVIDHPASQALVLSEQSGACDQVRGQTFTISQLLYSGCELNLSIAANNPPTRLVVQDKINSPALVVANIPLIELTWQHVRPNIPLAFSFHLVDGLLSNIRLSSKKITRSDLKFKLTSYSYSRDFHQLNVLRC